MARSIQSPGVEIIEKDLSLSPVLPAGTSIFMTGFAGKGPTDEILQITSLQEFEQVYGTPTNSAERYFYYSARQILNSSGGNLYVSRLPYGDGTGDGYGSSYGALVYPVMAVKEVFAEQYANTSIPVLSTMFALSSVNTKLNNNRELLARKNDFQVNGLTAFEIFSSKAGQDLVDGWNDYYNLNKNSGGFDSTLGFDVSALSLSAKNTASLFVKSTLQTKAQVYRNTALIPSRIFNFSTVDTAIDSIPSLFVIKSTLQTIGLTSYDTFNTVEGLALVTALESHFTSFQNSANIVLKNEALSAKIYSGYFVKNNEKIVTSDLSSDLKTKCSYVLGAPKYFDLTIQQYQGVLDGSAFSNTNYVWSQNSAPLTAINGPQDFGKAGMVILNKIQSTINNRFEGHYIGLADNTNIQPNTDHTAIKAIYTNGQPSAGTGLRINGNSATTKYLRIPESKLSFPLSATSDSGSNRNSDSISEALEKTGASFADITTAKFDDTISFGLFKLRTSPYNPDAVSLGYAFEEARSGSLDHYRQVNNPNGGIASSFFIENTVNGSNNINLYVNSYISSKNVGPWLDDEGFPIKKVRVFTENAYNSLVNSKENTAESFGYHLNNVPELKNNLDYADALFPIGCYSSFTTTGKSIGSLGFKIDRVLRKVENDELFDLDIVCEAGLGTIYATACANHVNYFDDAQSSDGLIAGLQSISQNEKSQVQDERDDVKTNYAAIFNAFDNFCSKLRKDCLFIADPLRQIFITGTNTKVLTDPNKAFSQYIYNPLKHLYEFANSSYSTVYGTWVKVLDIFSGLNIWVPFSGFAAADMANVDRDFEPWYAPAGFTRGRITNVLDVAIAPKQKERDMLYKISINPVAFFPNDGINIFGQKTLLRQPSSFDRINVRRLFLYLQKATKRTVKYFVFEPNTSYTRNRVIATLSPIFDRAKNTQGLYDYQIVCDQRNNPPEIIDQNELVVDIYIKPVRSAEFILVNFYATSTGANFSEIIGA
jgi:hypothetical protein